MGMVQESPPLAAGSLLDGYEIAEVLEQGRFSFTYRAYDSARGEVVIKEFLPQEFAVRDGGTVHARDPEDKTPLRFWLRSFLDKAVLLQKLNHPGLTRVLRQFEANGTGYYVAEYIPGESLAAILERQQTLSEAQLRRLLAPVLSGLEQAHAVNLLHRDIRPENLLVRPDDSAVLTNFGDLRAPIRFKSRTVFSSGLPPYAAPEEFYMAGPHGSWTDIYALGALAYRTICGVPPPDARSRASGTALTPVAQAARVRCSESFLVAVEQALLASAEQRPQTVAALRAALQGEGGEALPAAAPRAAAPRAAAAIPAALPPQKEHRGGSPLPLVLGGVALAAAAGGYFWLRPPSAPAAATAATTASATTGTAAPAAPDATAATPLAGAAPADDAGLDRLAQDMMAKEKKAAEAKQQLQALQQQREQQAAQDARNAAKSGASGAAVAAAAAAAPPAPSQAELDAAAHAKQLEDELAKLRAEKEAEEKARAAAAVATAAPATTTGAAAAAPPRDSAWTAWYRNASGEVKSSLRYPRSSLQAGEEGDVTVKVLIKRDGSVVRVSPIQRSEYPALDSEAVAVFSRIGRFPPVPADYSPSSNEVEFSMPINFKVE